MVLSLVVGRYIGMNPQEGVESSGTTLLRPYDQQRWKTGTILTRGPNLQVTLIKARGLIEREREGGRGKGRGQRERERDRERDEHLHICVSAHNHTMLVLIRKYVLDYFAYATHIPVHVTRCIGLHTCSYVRSMHTLRKLYFDPYCICLNFNLQSKMAFYLQERCRSILYPGSKVDQRQVGYLSNHVQN